MAQHIDNMTDKNQGMCTAPAEQVVTERKYKLQFAVDPEFMERLARIRSLLSTKYPGKIRFEMIFDILMQEYLERHDPERRHRRRLVRKARAGKEPGAGESANAPGVEKYISK